MKNNLSKGTNQTMKKESTSIIKYLPFSILIIVLSTGCMMGMKMGGTIMESILSESPSKVQMINTGHAVDQIIEEAVLDLSTQDLDINSVAVWRIKSQTAGLNVEVIRQKLITRLVTSNRFKVVTRQRLSELLKEQSLSLSGTVDEKSAVDIGNLIGVEGFVDGYASIENNRFILSLNLIETKSGVIVWAKTIERPIQP